MIIEHMNPRSCNSVCDRCGWTRKAFKSRSELEDCLIPLGYIFDDGKWLCPQCASQNGGDNGTQDP